MNRSERWLVALIVVVMAVLSFWLASDRTLDPGYVQPSADFNSDFYRQQAIAMLDGRLDVPDDNFRETECFYRDGRCFGYFGVAPSIIRLGGFLATGSQAFNPSPVIIAGGVAGALWAAIYLAIGVAGSSPFAQRLNARSRLWIIVLVGALLGPGGLLTFLSQAKLFYEAIVLMIAGMLVCFAFVQRWTINRRPLYLLFALLGGVLATNSRPAALVPMLIVGVGVIALGARDRSRDGQRSVVLGAALATIPLVTSFGVGWLKFRSLSPSFTNYTASNSPKMQELLQANDGELRGLRFVPSHVVNYLRPDSLAFDRAWPWVQHAVPGQKSPVLVAPLSPESLYVEYVASLPNTMPVAMLLTAGFTVLVVLGRGGLSMVARQTFAVLMVAAATAPIAVLTLYALTTRYLGDFFPLLAVGTAFALVSLLAALQNHPARRLVMVALTASAVVTFVINIGLQQQTFTIAG